MSLIEHRAPTSARHHADSEEFSMESAGELELGDAEQVRVKGGVEGAIAFALCETLVHWDEREVELSSAVEQGAPRKEVDAMDVDSGEATPSPACSDVYVSCPRGTFPRGRPFCRNGVLIVEGLTLSIFIGT